MTIRQGLRRGMPPTDIAFVLALCFPPFASAIDAYFGLPAQVFPILVLVTTLLLGATTLVVVDRRVPIARADYAALWLGIFLIVEAAANLRAGAAGIRWDVPAMWRQWLLAMSPGIFFWTARDWASRSFNVRVLDYGAIALLAVCASSILLEVLGYASYEAFGSRYFGFLGDQSAWLLSFTTVFFLGRGRIALFSFSLLLILITQSRGPLLITAIGISLILVFSRAADGKTHLIRIAMVITGLAMCSPPG